MVDRSVSKEPKNCKICGSPTEGHGVICSECTDSAKRKPEQDFVEPRVYVGHKNDAGKPRMSLLPWDMLMEIVMVMEDGAVEYGKDNWKKVPNAEDRYFDAMMRHLCDWKLGITYDAKSKKLNLAHAACCLLFLMWHTVVGEQKVKA